MIVTLKTLRVSKMQCFPLYNIMMAFDSPNVDHFRLRTDGDELAILKTLLWDKVSYFVSKALFTFGKDLQF